MPNTTRMGFPYPAENEEPHFDKMVSFFNAVDASGYAAREDRNIVIHKGGDIDFDSGTGVLSWMTAIEIYAPVTGFLWSLAAGQVTLDDGEAFYVDLTRAPTGNTAVAAVVTGQIPSSNNALVLGLRRGTKVYFRNGTLIETGVTVADIGGAPGGGGSVSHASTTGQTPNDHHDELHTIASHSDTTATGAELETLTDGSNADALHVHAAPSVTHASTTGQTADDHHNELHSIASHDDTTATGAELETLTDGSNADALHVHAFAAFDPDTILTAPDEIGEVLIDVDGNVLVSL